MLNYVNVVLDESGSMDANIDGALDGVNGFFRTLREQPANMRISLLKFSEKLRYVYERIFLADLHDLTTETYQPNGSTALYDSVLKTIADLEPVVEAHEARATVVIVTDGDDTCSRATLHEVRRHIEEKLATGRWTFLYFGPNPRVAQDMGIPKPRVFRLVPGSSEEIKAAFEVAATETIKQLTAGSGPIAL